MEKFARVCDVTGKGMNEGWCWGDGSFYTATEEVTIAELRKDYPQHKDLSDEELMSWAYDEEILYWTEWYDEELEPGDIYYDAEGNEFEIEEELEIKNENKMDILHYTIDLKDLFDTQDRQLVANKTAEEEKQEEFKRNKKELLKYVLPLMHGIYALHNRKCLKSSSSVTGETGMLGLHKVNIEEKLNFIVENDYYFKDNGATFKCAQFGQVIQSEITVWLPRHGKMNVTPHLGYTMLGLINDDVTYAESIESELIKLAKKCAIFTEEWK
jgi:hypothetical protein